MTIKMPILPESILEKIKRREITQSDADRFGEHLRRIERELYSHDVIHRNPYTQWFKRGDANTEQVKDLVVQFSVFSNHFVPLEAKRMVNAATEKEECEARSILGSEIGVPINVKTGDIEGRIFSHHNAHIKWLRDIGEMLGLNRDLLGKWKMGSAATHEFLERLEEVYGSHDNDIGAGASFAIESWAGYGIGKGAQAESNNFWKELITGLEAYNTRHRVHDGLPALNAGFFRFHFKLELGHVASVEHELAETFFSPGFVPDKWFDGAAKALRAILIFWTGLDERRRVLPTTDSPAATPSE